MARTQSLFAGQRKHTNRNTQPNTPTQNTTHSPANTPVQPAQDSILQLQKTVGNRATIQMLSASQNVAQLHRGKGKRPKRKQQKNDRQDRAFNKRASLFPADGPSLTEETETITPTEDQHDTPPPDIIVHPESEEDGVSVHSDGDSLSETTEPVEAHDAPQPDIIERPEPKANGAAVREWHRQKRSTAKVPRTMRRFPQEKRDDSKLNMPEMPGKSVRAYRAEVDTFNPKYGHVLIDKKKNATIYNPRPEASEYENIGKGKKTPSRYMPVKKDKEFQKQQFAAKKARKEWVRKKGWDTAPDLHKAPKVEKPLKKYGREFIKGREHQPHGTMGWINFGDPERAAEFYHQKMSNPTERKKGNTFDIKSFSVPSEILKVIQDEAVHEREKGKHPTKPINVDRESPNQFGLQQHHLELLNTTMIPGSGRMEDPQKLWSPPREKSVRRAKKKADPKPQKPTSRHGKGAFNQHAALADYYDEEAIADDVTSEMEQDWDEEEWPEEEDWSEDYWEEEEWD